MIEEILSELNIKFQETRFLVPPKETYIVYHDERQYRGADDHPDLIAHTITIELFAYQKDRVSEAAIESALYRRGFSFRKSDRDYLKPENMFVTVFTFDYLEKRGIPLG
jgi:hypothetical protein